MAGKKILLTIFFVLTFFSHHVIADEETIILGVHPYKSPSKLIKAFSPLAEYLSRKSGKKIELRISRDYQSHIDNIGTKKINIAFMGPAPYIKMVNLYGKKPILARLEINGKPTFQGKIIIRKDSDIKNLADLKNRRFAFGDPNSTMSHLVPRYMLIEAGIDIEKNLPHKFLGSHDNVALGVLSGDYDAGAVKEAVFFKYQPRGLRELASTPALSEHLFVTCGSFNEKDLNKMRNIMYNMHESSEGKKILQNIKKTITALSPAEDKDYDNLRKILKSLTDQGISW